MYYLGLEFFNRRVSFWTAALFQCLPVVARVTSDALSEATFLLTSVVTLLLAVRSLRDYSVWRLALCGATGGCCYLIRPEGALTVVSVLTVLLGLQTLPRWHRPWSTVLPAVGSLSVSAAIVAGPYIAVIGHVTNKPTGQAVMEVAQAGVRNQESGVRVQKSGRHLWSPDSCPLTPCLLAVWWHPEGEKDWFERFMWGLGAEVNQVIRGFAYVAWLPVLLGLGWYYRRMPEKPAAWIITVLCGFHAILLCRVGTVVGYISERHVLIIVLCGLYWAVWAISRMARRWRQARSRLRIDVSSAVIVTFMLACLPMTLQPLHANQVGHREAGLWLALHCRPGDTIVDPFDWSYFYAGRVFEEECSPLPDRQAVRYVVLEHTRKPHAELTMLPLAKELAEGGQVVYDWQPNKHQLKHKAQEVQIFAIPINSQ
jgi:hypothetical protein